MKTEWNQGKLHRLEEFKKEVNKLASKHDTTPKVLCSLFTDLNQEEDWRNLFNWKECHDFFWQYSMDLRNE